MADLKQVRNRWSHWLICMQSISQWALYLHHTSISLAEYIPGVSQFCLKEWQDIWNCCESNKLHAIYPNVGRIPHCKNLSRRDAVVINRLRTGHTRLTHLHLLTGEDLPTWQFCSLPLTVNHILLECANLNTIRQRFFRVSSLKDLFDSIDNQIVIDFIKQTHFTLLYNVCYHHCKLQLSKNQSNFSRVIRIRKDTLKGNLNWMLTALWCYTNWHMYYLNLSGKLQHIRAFGLPQFFALLDSCYSILLPRFSSMTSTQLVS